LYSSRRPASQEKLLQALATQIVPGIQQGDLMRGFEKVVVARNGREKDLTYEHPVAIEVGNGLVRGSSHDCKFSCLRKRRRRKS